MESHVPQEPLYSVVHGNNDELFHRVSRLYLKDGCRIADVTYGKGVFWKKIDTGQYDFWPSDLITCPDALYDLFFLLLCGCEFLMSLFWILRIYIPRQQHIAIVNKNYRNNETTSGFPTKT